MSDLNEKDIAEYQENQQENQQDKSITIDVKKLDIPDGFKDFLINAPMKSSVDWDLYEWSKHITELSEKEVQLLKLKDVIFDKEQWIMDNTDFKEVYGKNNSDVRKLHLNKHMKSEYDKRRDLEISIDYLKRRIGFLKQLIHTKTVILEVKE